MIVYFEAKQPARVADKNIFSSELLFLAGFTSPFGSSPFSLGSQALIFSFLGTFVFRVEIQSVFRRTKKTGAKLFRGYHSQFTLNYRRITQYEYSVKYVQYSGTQSFHVEVKSMHAVRY